MPSGRTHDLLTILTAIPAAAAAWIVTGDAPSVAAGLIGYLFGSLVFGPDLDTTSTQYSRWGIFRFLWMPYKAFFKHRSRWTHGIILGSLIRIVYFFGVITLAILAGSWIYASLAGAKVISPAELAQMWRSAGGHVRGVTGTRLLLIAFIGTWAGAAVHTFTDAAVTYIRTGRVTKVL